MTRAAIAAFACACLLAPAAARAHGTIPTSNSVSFGPGDGGLLLGTNFGGVLRVAGGDDRFLCERLVTGEQTSVDVWLWLASGGVAGVVTQGGFIRGVYVSDADTCGFAIVPGTEPLLMTDLAADPERASGFWAVGATTGADAEARLVRRGDSGVDVVASAPGAIATAVRAAGAHAYSVFLLGDEARLVHAGPDGVETFVHPRPDDAVIRPLGVDPTTPTTLWVVTSTADADVLARSTDAGETLVPVLTVAARLGGFAKDGDDVWVQSAQLGVHHAGDGGASFAPVAESPHGTCLGLGPDRRLYACGVPWQDGMALGVSADGGATFTPVLPFYDDIVGAVACAAAPAATALCDDELDFLRAYYGFADPNVGDPAPERVEAVEASPEPGPEATAEVGVEPAPPGGDDGCAGGGGVPLGALGALGAALVARGARRRRRA